MGMADAGSVVGPPMPGAQEPGVHFPHSTPRGFTPKPAAWPALRPYQSQVGRAVIDSVLDRCGLTITVVMARQAGKNEISAQAEAFLRREFRPMAAPAGATTVYYGTPWDDSTLLERAVQTNRELERRDGIRRHFAADWTAVAEFNPEYARYVEGERARLGEDHPLFRTQYALKTLSGGGRLFSGSQQAQIRGTHPRQHSPRPGEVYVAGLDVGGQDGSGGNEKWEMGNEAGGARHDATVLTSGGALMSASDALVREPRVEIVEHIAFSGTAHDALFARLADLLGEVWRVRRPAVGATGLGETLARLLDRRLGARAVRTDGIPDDVHCHT